ncbi:uncharacterized protein LOC116203765 isoform X2 [Punica granatum]|uniref:Uncharacterized protein LOC116203765 isoform X2 n=1 Tax=Punica granatum TaxID=22663 RepID=A0A6P8D354_PUNGR|nr:uncharacterized protein LOC116203765 isoform X2 [Punica granatum]
MTMLPVCSATTCCSSSHCQIPLNGGVRSFYSPRKEFESRWMMDSMFLGSSSGKILNKVTFRTQATGFSAVDINTSIDRSVLNSSVKPTNEPHGMEKVHLRFLQISEVPVTEEGSVDFTEQSVDSVTALPDLIEAEGTTTIDVTPDPSTLTSEPQFTDSSSSSELKTSVQDIISGINDSLSASVEKGQSTLNNLLDSVNSSIASVSKGANEAIENATGRLSSSVDQMGESASYKLTNISSDLKGAASKAGAIGVDVLRGTIVAFEDSLAKGASLVVSSHSSAKEFLPPEIKDTLDLSEAKTAEILKPVGVLTQQVSFAIGELERNLGLDPSDPIVSFVLFLGTASTLWAFYWVWTYSGYSGDLSPNTTLQLLMGKENAVLIDIRPEILRETDGIPDLRRTARYRYSSVSLPEVDGSIRKLLKSGRDVEDCLIAVVIRNLKIVKDRSKVIVMDADGTRSKGIARSLKKLGVKGPYMVEGGFRSWVSQGLRIKELKPETTLSVLNEEAEAILEEINPSPLQVFATGMGFIAALYALVEWEKTLQIIGIFGLGQFGLRPGNSRQTESAFQHHLHPPMCKTVSCRLLRGTSPSHPRTKGARSSLPNPFLLPLTAENSPKHKQFHTVSSAGFQFIGLMRSL